MEINTVGLTNVATPSVGTTQRVDTGSSNAPAVQEVKAPIQPVIKQSSGAEFGDKPVYAEDKPLSEDKIISTIEKANKEFTAFDRRFEFSIHESTKQIMVKIIDVNTNEIIRELPPEKVLDIVAKRWKEAGIIVDEKV